LKFLKEIFMNTTDFTIERVANPAAFYQHNSEELDLTGADAFGQPTANFAPQVAERFEKASIAQVMRCGPRIAGFALFDVLRSRHWQCTVN
jgi:hypothetical protein